MNFRCRGPDACPMATADGPVDYPDLLFLVAVIAV